jgi:hypothetical protein
VAIVVGVCGRAYGGQQASPPPPPDPQTQDVAALRATIEQLRQQLDALERKVAALEAAAPPASAPAPTPAPEPAPAPQAAVPEPTAPMPAPQPAAAGSSGSKIFNPDIAVIGNVVSAVGSNTIDPRPAISLDEAELSLQAIVDPYARADFFLSASPDGVEVEEGFITFPTLPGGFLLKAGKLKAQFGKVNTQHVHVLPWVDTPLPMQNLLGGEEGLSDAGFSVSRLIPNKLLFLEATGEVYDGNNAVFTSHERSDLTYVARLRGYRDLTEGTHLDVGTSFATGTNTQEETTQLFGVDATFRYRPLRRAIYQRFLARTELFWSNREIGQDLPRQDAFGAYVTGEYQFARRWIAGGRYDWSGRAYDATLKDKSGSFLLTYWPSEFSQIRGQYRRTSYAEGVDANEVLFQFLFAIGAHGAHAF